MESKLPELVLLVLDLTMPGWSACVSAYPAEDEREQAMRMGASDYITASLSSFPTCYNAYKPI